MTLLCRYVKYVVAFLCLFCVSLYLLAPPTADLAVRRQSVWLSLGVSGAVTLGVFAVRTHRQAGSPASPVPSPADGAHAPR